MPMTSWTGRECLRWRCMKSVRTSSRKSFVKLESQLRELQQDCRSLSPMSKNVMTRSRGRTRARAQDQFSPPQMGERGVDRAFGEAGGFSERAKTCRDRPPLFADALSIQIQVNEIGGRFLVVSDQVAHQDIEHIIVNRNGDFESRHDVDLSSIPINGQHFFMPAFA